MKDKFAFLEAYRNPIAKRRKLLAKPPFAKRAVFKDPFKLDQVSFSTTEKRSWGYDTLTLRLFWTEEPGRQNARTRKDLPMQYARKETFSTWLGFAHQRKKKGSKVLLNKRGRGGAAGNYLAVFPEEKLGPPTPKVSL